ncbi:MATE family efflux transporter [Patescibacteria group bacterium]
MKKLDYTKAPLIKSLVVLSIPIILANIMQTLYGLIDTFWVGRLGASAVAAVSLSFPVLFLVLALGLGMSIAGTILVAQYKGKKDNKNVNLVSGQTFLMMIVSAVILSIIGWFVAKPILVLLGAAPDVLPEAVSYLRIMFFGMFLLFVYFVFQALMRGVGEVITPMIIVAGTVVLNLILDPIFILGWGPIPSYGVSGAAIVTIISQGLAAVVGMSLLLSGRYDIHLKLADFKPNFTLIKKMIRLGLPMSVEEVFRALAMFFLFYLVARFGTDTVAAFGVGIRILSFVIIPAAGLAMATTTIVGQSIGAKKIDRAEKITWKSSGIGFLIMTAVSVFTFFIAEPVSAFFVPGETEVIQQSTEFLKILSLAFGFITVQHVLLGTIKGAGETFAAMLLNMFSKAFLLIPVAWFLSMNTELGEAGIWWAYPVTYFIATILAVAWFLRGSWKKKNITEGSHP